MRLGRLQKEARVVVSRIGRRDLRALRIERRRFLQRLAGFFRALLLLHIGGECPEIRDGARKVVERHTRTRAAETGLEIVRIERPQANDNLTDAAIVAAPTPAIGDGC